MLKYRRMLLPVVFTLSLLLAACQPADNEPGATPDQTELPGTGEMLPEEGFPEINVSDQEIVEGTIVINDVINPGIGWVVIYADDNGSLGPIIGFAPVIGSTVDVRVDIDSDHTTSTLHAVLHEDRGMIGEFEYPGPDVPVEFNGVFVTESFQVTGDQQ
jgi:hypothetical protein